MNKPKGIPISHAMICANIQHWFASADDFEYAEGTRWYYDAYEFCRQMSEQLNLRLETAAAIVAVLSPGTNWQRNQKDAKAVARGIPGYRCTTYRVNVEKATRLLFGEPVENVLGGKKVKAFYECMKDPWAHNGAVCIDRHAVRLATGWDLDTCYKYLGRVGVYEKIAECYRVVANHYGLKPWQVQAVTWIAFRNSLRNKEQ